MGGITRVGDKNTGHDACPPVALASGSPTVSVEGRAVGRIGDPYETHGCKDHPSHVGTISAGAAHVFVNGKAVARVGDPVSCGGTVAEGSSTVTIGDGGGEEMAIENEATRIMDFVDLTSDSEKTAEDEIIAHIPEIAIAEAGRRTFEADRQGWEELAAMMKIWLAGEDFDYTVEKDKLGEVDHHSLPFDWSWFIFYSRFYNAYRKLIDEKALNAAGQQQLVEYLQELSQWETGGEFIFSDKPQSEWLKYYFNYVTVPRGLYWDGMEACLAAHTIRVLADGSISVDASGMRTIKVDALYVFVYDGFNFGDEKDLSESYRFWSKQEKSFAMTNFADNKAYRELTNAEFHRFKERYGKGKDFAVFSALHKSEEFSGKTFYYLKGACFN